MATSLSASAADVPARGVDAVGAAAPPTGGYSARSLVANANADLAAGHPGRALLQLERARLIAPRAAAVLEGLERARAGSGLPLPQTGRLSGALHRLSSDEWTGLALVGLTLAAAALVLMVWRTPRRRTAAGALAIAAATLGAGGLSAALAMAPPPDRAIVVAPATVARIAPFQNAEPIRFVAEGTSVTIERAHGGYVLVQAGDTQGWVPSGAVEAILPAPEHRP